MEKIRTSAYRPQTNSAAESYNRTIIKYMRAMLDNNSTLDWEEQLYPLMMSYNTHIHQSTKETPFFLTFAHDPRLPYFDLQQPRVNMGESYAAESFTNVQAAFRSITDNMKEAEEIRNTYYNLRTKERKFKAGERVMVYFPNTPPGVNHKFYKKWRLMIIVKTLGRLNVQVKEYNTRHESLVHIDRVRHAKVKEIQEYCDSTSTSYAHHQDFFYERGQKLFTKQIPEEEREKDEPMQLFFYNQNNAADSAPDASDDLFQPNQGEDDNSPFPSVENGNDTSNDTSSSFHSADSDNNGGQHGTTDFGPEWFPVTSAPGRQDNEDASSPAQQRDNDVEEGEPGSRGLPEDAAGAGGLIYDAWGRLAKAIFPSACDEGGGGGGIGGGRRTRSQAKADKKPTPEYNLVKPRKQRRSSGGYQQQQ